MDEIAADAFVQVATLAEVPPGTAKAVEVAGRRIALVNVRGAIYAIDDTCTHERVSLSSGQVTGEVIVCPKHGSRFHVVTGRVLSLPAVRPVSTYAVKVEGDAILVAPSPRPGQGMPHRR
ncbi:MAG: non-heme iron oxygenase ferredoxin subunit [Armatimonadota bacterium]|nr:non-heme iron oxygenase ferredoxin subunit [Armatimonadota bacterium]MDR7533436.1 non-heme iron oxygenase ferredoxin subunit [Armatimonadota bacterium]MDR7536250.1 non-heme iron oxygenase ferredoxin subunit [Armatimonadota bacterium]